MRGTGPLLRAAWLCPAPIPRHVNSRGYFLPLPSPSPSLSFSQQRSAPFKTNKQKNVFQNRQPIPHQIRQMTYGFFFGSELVSVPLSSPEHQALCSAVPKSRRLSPDPAGRSQLSGRPSRERGSGSVLHRCSRKQILWGFFFYPPPSLRPPECQRPSPRRLPTQGTSIAHRPQQLLISPAALEPRSQHGGVRGDPPPGLGTLREGLLWQLGQACSFSPADICREDSSAPTHAWEKLAAARSCGRRARSSHACLVLGEMGGDAPCSTRS